MNGSTLLGWGTIGLWPFLALLSRGAADIPPLQLTAMAFAVSSLPGLSVVALQGSLPDLRQPPVAWVHGIGGLAGFHVLCFASLHLAPPAEANLINYLWPLLTVAFAALVLGMRLTWRRVAQLCAGNRLGYATPVASTLLLCAAGFAPFSTTLMAAASLVTAGGMLATRK